MNPDSELTSIWGASSDSANYMLGPNSGREPYRRPDCGVAANAVCLYRYIRESNSDGEIVMGRLLIGLGVALVIAGVAVIVLERAGLGLGRMPGDFAYRGRNVQVSFPLGTCIVLSVLLSVVFYLLSKLHR
jgi:hypothetical protein